MLTRGPIPMTTVRMDPSPATRAANPPPSSPSAGEEEEEAEREVDVDVEVEMDEAEEEEEEEEVEEQEADVPLAKITKADHHENIDRFVVGVFLRRGGQMQFQIVTKANHEKLAGENKSAWSAYAAFFLKPADRDLGAALRRFSDQLKLLRHHEGDCVARCGCKLGGMNFVKLLGFEDDQRKLAALFQPGRPGRKLLLEQHRLKSADQLARELAAQMAALQKANQAGCKPAGASKRPREGADPGRPRRALAPVHEESIKQKAYQAMEERAQAEASKGAGGEQKFVNMMLDAARQIDQKKAEIHELLQATSYAMGTKSKAHAANLT